MLIVLIATASFFAERAASLGTRNFLPKETMGLRNEEMHLGWTPMPTSPPIAGPDHNWLRKRDATSVCGYVSGLRNEPLSCDSGFCGYNSNLGAVGCCASTFGPDSVTDCTFFTSCFDATASAGCDAACQSNTLNGFCTSPYPYCVTNVFLGGGNTYISYGCGSTSATYLALLTPTGGNPFNSSTTSASIPGTSSVQSVDSSSTRTNGLSPFSSQQSGGGATATVPSTTGGVGPLVHVAGESWLVWMVCQVFWRFL